MATVCFPHCRAAAPDSGAGPSYTIVCQIEVPAFITDIGRSMMVHYIYIDSSTNTHTYTHTHSQYIWAEDETSQTVVLSVGEVIYFFYVFIYLLFFFFGGGGWYI